MLVDLFLPICATYLVSRSNLGIPKFEDETELALVPILQPLGMEDVFSENADLSGIDGRTDLVVSDAIHKATVKVDEEGTVATAATGIIVVDIGASEPLNLVFDRPFFYFIEDIQTGTILFIGRKVE